MFDSEGALAELAGLEADLGRVADALHHLDDGTYGTCAVCGVAIPDAVEADPLASRCVEHDDT